MRQEEVKYAEAVRWLYGQQLHGIQPGLERMRRLCAALDLPTALTGPPDDRCRAVHVAGTNGKGSVCAMVDAICRAAGWRTGLYTSPHLVSFRERMKVDGAAIGEVEAAEGLTRIRGIIEGWPHPATFFEIVTALALWHFQRCQCDVVVLETGLGGRLDATNVVTPAVAAITSIGLDHQQWLGDTLEQVAREKAGIMKPGRPVVIAPQEPAAAGVLRRAADDAGAIARVIEEPLRDGTVLNLPGAHQRWNAAVAQAIAQQLDASADAIAEGLRTVQWPGRFQRVGDGIVLDGAHNPAAAATLAAAWRELFPGQKATLIFGAMTDKDVPGICRALAPIVERVFTVAVNNTRSCTAEALADAAAKAMPGIDARPAPSLAEALHQARPLPSPILIAGSLFLVGEALVALGLATPEGEHSEQ